ncbi:MAG: hypothetical protein KDI14_04815 [Halioglobus sp.]|nr:hypothetical protein [Halioglobus sp.]
MYRYSVDNAVTFTSEDVVLFREAPFACWMERLTLENPDHGIPPDVGSVPPRGVTQPQDELADTLRAEGKDVRLIDWDMDEAMRRKATLEAMYEGADFIVNGQLAHESLSTPVNLLVRTSGYSSLGDFLYIPCDTQNGKTSRSIFGLCFQADLLDYLQGQLPPQMFIIQGGDDLVPLPTENHIYHYRAVKQRFVESMRSFRKHRMPDPAESAHFGRWSECACEVLKQRMLREENRVDETDARDQVQEAEQEQRREPGQAQEREYVEPLRQAMGAAAGGGQNPYDLDDIRPAAGLAGDARALAMALTGVGTVSAAQSAPVVNLTLVEQARMLKPGTYKPGPGVYRLGPPRAVRNEAAQSRAGAGGPEAAAASFPDALPTAPDKRRYNRRISDAALQNLEFIGSSEPAAAIDSDSASTVPPPPAAGSAPAPSLRDPRVRTSPATEIAALQAPGSILGRETVWGISADAQPAETPSGSAVLGPVRPQPAVRPSIDMDSTHVATPGPRLSTARDKTDN